MSKLMIAVMGLAMLTASVKAELGETPQQFESFRPTTVANMDNGIVVMTWVGKRVTHSGIFVHNAAVFESFWFNDHHEMSEADTRRFMKPYGLNQTKFYVGDGEFFSYVASNGDVLAITAYDFKDNRIDVWTADTFNDWVHEDDSEPAERRDPMKDHDCAITATENLHRLAPTSAWSNMLVFDVYKNDRKISGHAVAVWKIAADSKVMVVDENGTLEIETTSTNEKDILMALEAKYSVMEHATVKLVGHLAVATASTK